MSWIKTIDYAEAEGPLKRMYNRVKGPDDNVDNVLSIHSLRPHTLTGHMTLYKSVLHNTNGFCCMPSLACAMISGRYLFNSTSKIVFLISINFRLKIQK